MIEKKKVELMLKENAEALRDNEKTLYGPKFEEAVAKSLTSTNKLREFFGILKEQGTSLGNKDSKKQQHFSEGFPISCHRKLRGRNILRN